jgi:hypothetical protein
MTSLPICILCFIVTFMLTRRSAVWGLACCIAVGYVFGVLKANIFDLYSYFIWDSSVLGFYASFFSRHVSQEELDRTHGLRMWVTAFMVWPVILTLVPVQYPLIQLVGLRANIFLLPFLLIGTRLKPEEFNKLAFAVAVLNLAALGVGTIEYFAGVEQFFPRNQVTEIIYKSKDVAGFTAFRIPAFFANPHSYAGTMVMTLPILFGAWVRERIAWHQNLLSAGMMAALLGVLLAASRTHMVMLCAVVVFVLINGKLKSLGRVSLIMMLLFVAGIVSNSERLQRFTTLFDSESVAERITGSINLPFLDAALEYPFGIGMGGGGTSIPYFLHDEIIQPVAAENEYARIMLEEGVLGLVMWVGFVAWIATRRSDPRMQHSLGRSAARFVTVGYFVMACLGTGLMTSVPQSLLLMLCAGWACAGMDYPRAEARLQKAVA